MSAPVVAAIVQLIGPIIGAEVFDGETPRYDVKGNPINPQSITGNWPAVIAKLEHNAVTRKRMFGGQYIDLANVSLEVWGSERGQEERVGALLDSLLQLASSWTQMTNIMKSLDPTVVTVVHARVDTWSSTQEEDTRTRKSRLVYLGTKRVEVRVHGIMRVN